MGKKLDLNIGGEWHKVICADESIFDVIEFGTGEENEQTRDIDFRELAKKCVDSGSGNLLPPFVSTLLHTSK